MPKDDLERFRRRCGQLRLAATLVLVGLGGLLLAIYVVFPLIDTAVHGFQNRSREDLLSGLVRFLPTAFYLWALWSIRQALGDIAAGRLFNPAVARALRRVGYGVIIGSLLSIFAVTNLIRIITGGQGGFAFFDVSGMVLTVVGASLVLLATLVERAGGIEAELDEMI